MIFFLREGLDYTNNWLSDDYKSYRKSVAIT